jgi:hypothetical protein
VPAAGQHVVLFIITRRASLLNDFVTSLNRLGLLQPMEYEGGIIDWVDQAILYTHLSPGGDEKDRGIKELEEQRRRELRSLGVRTATSLVALIQQVPERSAPPPRTTTRFLIRLAALRPPRSMHEEFG